MNSYSTWNLFANFLTHNVTLVICSRGDSQEYADLNKLARKFLETNPDSANPNQKLPTKAYVEEVVEEIRRGDNTECPICLESADDPVLTPCAHRMCRECLLSSWRTPSAGVCPICRQLLKKSDLITCPSENRFRIDVVNNWKESSKVTKLLECLENISKSGSGEKSIVFSQWTSFLDLLEIPLKRKKIGFLRFDGRLAQKQRERVLKEFNETSEKMVSAVFLFSCCFKNSFQKTYQITRFEHKTVVFIFFDVFPKTSPKPGYLFFEAQERKVENKINQKGL